MPTHDDTGRAAGGVGGHGGRDRDKRRRLHATDLRRAPPAGGRRATSGRRRHGANTLRSSDLPGSVLARP